jgi:hypothetical protein
MPRAKAAPELARKFSKCTMHISVATKTHESSVQFSSLEQTRYLFGAEEDLK